jgi:hypothetical protein
MIRCCSIVALAGLAVSAGAQDFTIAAAAPAQVNPGETFVVEFWGAVEGPGFIDGVSAISGFGIDALGSGAVASVTTANVASNLSVGVLTGTVNGSNVEGIVAGQLANIFNLNPGISFDNPMFLFSIEVTAGAAGVIVYTGGNPNPNGGLNYYPNSTSGESVSALVDPGTTLTFVQATTLIVPAPASLALLGLGGLVARRRR